MTSEGSIFPDYSSHKVYFDGAKDYVSPGSYVSISEVQSVFQIISVLPCTNAEVPLSIQQRARCNSKSQIMKLLRYKRLSEITMRTTPLRQRAVRDVTEVVKTSEITYELNTNIESVCFIFHSQDILSGKYVCSGISDAYVIRQKVSTNNSTLEPIESEFFLPFPTLDVTNRFSSLYSSDYCSQVWNGIAKIRETINGIMCRRKINQGVSFCQCKSMALHLAPSTWTYLVLKLQKMSTIQVHTYKRSARKAVLKYGLLYESVSITKEWQHVRFETTNDFTVLQSLVGSSISFGVEKKRPSKRQNYQSALHENDTCHVFNLRNERTEFKTRSPLTMGVDLLFSEYDGLKVWARYSTMRAAEHPEINAFFLELQRTPTNLQNSIDSSTLRDVVLVAGRTTFQMNSCVFRVIEAHDFFVIAKVLQSRNESYVRGNNYQFDNVNEIKISILNKSRRR